MRKLVNTCTVISVIVILHLVNTIEANTRPLKDPVRRIVKTQTKTSKYFSSKNEIKAHGKLSEKSSDNINHFEPWRSLLIQNSEAEPNTVEFSKNKQKPLEQIIKNDNVKELSKKVNNDNKPSVNQLDNIIKSLQELPFADILKMQKKLDAEIEKLKSKSTNPNDKNLPDVELKRKDINVNEIHLDSDDQSSDSLENRNELISFVPSYALSPSSNTDCFQIFVNKRMEIIGSGNENAYIQWLKLLKDPISLMAASLEYSRCIFGQMASKLLYLSSQYGNLLPIIDASSSHFASTEPKDDEEAFTK